MPLGSKLSDRRGLGDRLEQLGTGGDVVNLLETILTTPIHLAIGIANLNLSLDLAVWIVLLAILLVSTSRIVVRKRRR